MRASGKSARAALGLGLCLALPLAAQETPDEGGQEPRAEGGSGQQDAAPEEPGSAASSGSSTAARYRGLDEADDLVGAWLGTGLCETLELGASFGGRPLFGVQFGGWGQTPLAERTTVLLVGGLDGVSFAGSEAVLHAVDALLAEPDRLPSDVTFVALPWANPDGLARSLAEGGDGRNDRPLDDDADGALDEDGPDDLDGDGLVLELLVEDPAGPWVRCTDQRFLRLARPGEAPRYVHTREGRDDDGDGLYNEDGPGGIALERNFPVGWRSPLVDPAGGRWPLSEPAARSLAELALARRTACALVFQGSHGGLALSASAGGAVEDVAAPAFVTLGELFSQATGRGPKLVSAPATGDALSWFAELGVLAVEVAAWGPGVDSLGADAVDAQYVPNDWRPEELRELSPKLLELAAADRAWARWLDDMHGGIGFVGWQPVDLGDGRRGLVGGWQPRTRVNPPATALAGALEGLERFVLDVACALPRLDVELLEARRDGELCVLRARLRNTCALPSGLVSDGADGRLRFSLDVPEGVALLAGSTTHELGPVAGRGASEELAWLLVAPQGTVFTLRVETPWCGTLQREVRL